MLPMTKKDIEDVKMLVAREEMSKYLEHVGILNGQCGPGFI